MIRVFADTASLDAAAAALFVKQAESAIEAHGRFSVALAGGGTPGGMYRRLAQPPLSTTVDWGRVHLFWGDERCVGPDDPRSNARMAREALLDHVPIPKDQVHPISCHHDPAGAARDYDALLRDFFAPEGPTFDLVLLGLGENGHTASLFPHTEALDAQAHWAARVRVAGQDYERVTLTAPVINRAQRVVFLVSGAQKAAVLKEVLTGPPDPLRLPAQLIRPGEENLIWLADRAAAARLEKTS